MTLEELLKKRAQSPFSNVQAGRVRKKMAEIIREKFGINVGETEIRPNSLASKRWGFRNDDFTWSWQSIYVTWENPFNPHSGYDVIIGSDYTMSALLRCDALIAIYGDGLELSIMPCLKDFPYAWKVIQDGSDEDKAYVLAHKNTYLCKTTGKLRTR